MFVVKVGEYYVRTIDYNNHDITLSKELMRGFYKQDADKIAKMIYGEVIEIKRQDTMYEVVENE